MDSEYKELFQYRLKGKKKNYTVWWKMKPKLIEFVAISEKYLDKIKEMIKQPSVPRRKTRKGTGG